MNVLEKWGLVMCLLGIAAASSSDMSLFLLLFTVVVGTSAFMFGHLINDNEW